MFFKKAAAILCCIREALVSDGEDILNGNTASFGKIMRRYNSSIFRICLSHLGGREEAEDAVQEIFLRAYRSLNTFRLDKRFWTWLYSIAMNHLKTHYSRLKRLDDLKERAGQNIKFHQSDPVGLFVQQETRQEIQQAVELLPSDFKKVVNLYYEKEMSVSDISRTIGISRENVKIKLYRAQNRLKEIIESYISGGEKVLSNNNEEPSISKAFNP